MQERLRGLREQIDRHDEQIVALLARRLSLAKEIAVAKREISMGILQADRELEIIGRVRRSARAAGLGEDFVERIFVLILAESKKIQREHSK